jgi:CRISPR system Cascade subunit CasB
METPVVDRKQRPEAFIGMLLQLDKEQNREAIAHLRGYVRGTTDDAIRAAKYVAPFLGENAYPSDHWFYVVGGLFAFHPAHTEERVSLGKALGRLRGESGSMDQRVLALLATSADALDKPLFQSISLLRANGIPLNFFRLLNDLGRWGSDNNQVQKNWARDYFRSVNSDNDSNTTESETNSDEN